MCVTGWLAMRKMCRNTETDCYGYKCVCVCGAVWQQQQQPCSHAILQQYEQNCAFQCLHVHTHTHTHLYKYIFASCTHLLSGVALLSTAPIPSFVPFSMCNHTHSIISSSIRVFIHSIVHLFGCIDVFIWPIRLVCRFTVGISLDFNYFEYSNYGVIQMYGIYLCLILYIFIFIQYVTKNKKTLRSTARKL